jgi:hypothetical protein
MTRSSEKQATVPLCRCGTVRLGLQPTVHFWFAAPVHVQIRSLVPFAELLPVASRHLLAAALTMSCDDSTRHA